MSPNKPNQPPSPIADTALAEVSAEILAENVPSDSEESSVELKLKLVNLSSDFQDPKEESPRSTSSDFKDAMQPTHPDSNERRGWPIWLFGVTVIVGIAVIGWQARLAGELEARVLSLASELAQANDLVDAHRAHLGEIRGGVSDLALRLEGLRALVDSDVELDPGNVVVNTGPPAP